MKIRTLLISAFVILGFSVLSFAQVPSYVPTNGLQGWWPFDGNGNDLSVNANNATNFGATFVTDRNGNPNSASSFDGVGNYMEVTIPSFALAENGSFTYSVWLKKQAQTSPGVVLMIGTNTAGNFISLIQGMNETQFGTNKQQSAWIWLSCPHTLNAWDHYVATYNAGIMNLYKNGAFQGTTTYTYTGAATANMPLYFGKGVGGNNYTGDLDDVGIWNRELTLTEISGLSQGYQFAIITNPVNQTVNLMGVATFSVEASPAAVTYQWQTSTGLAYSNLTNTGQYNGATNDTLIVSNATLANNNQLFRCQVSLGTSNLMSTVATMHVNNSVNINELSGDQQFSIFPNPATAFITLRLIPELLGSDIELFDFTGKKVLSFNATSEDTRVDISALIPGLYFCHIRNKANHILEISKQ